MSEQRNSSTKERKRRSRIACKQCRQSKVKCGMTAAPCVRCQRNGLVCQWDPNYRRTRTNDRVSQLEEQIRQLQDGSHGPEQGSISLTSTPLQNELVDTQTAEVPLDPPSENMNQGQDIHQSSQSHNSTPYTASTTFEPSYEIEDIHISHQAANEMFATYFEKFHPHLPFLDPGRTPEVYYNHNSLLFWIIIAVAGRDHSPQEDFFIRLSPYLSNSVSTIISEGGYKRLGLGHVQALLLMSLWPPYNVPSCGDRCMMLANLALTIASNYGFHNPGYEKEYNRFSGPLTTLEQSERVNTWATCVAVVQNLSIDFGTPSLAPFDNWKINELCDSTQLQQQNTTDVPLDIIHYLIIQRTGNVFYRMLPDRAGKNYTESTLLDALSSNEVEAEQIGNIKNLSLLNRLRHLALLLHIRSIYFTLSDSNMHRKTGILRAYHTATDLLTIVVSEEGAREIMIHSPRIMLRMIFHAACVVFLVLHSSYRCDAEYMAGKVLARATEMSFKLQTVGYQRQKELPARYADILRELWRFYETDQRLLSSPPHLVVHTRFGASIVYHCFALYYSRLQHRAIKNKTCNTTNMPPTVVITEKPHSEILQPPNEEDIELESFSLDSIWANCLDEAIDVFNFF